MTKPDYNKIRKLNNHLSYQIITYKKYDKGNIFYGIICYIDNKIIEFKPNGLTGYYYTSNIQNLEKQIRLRYKLNTKTKFTKNNQSFNSKIYKGTNGIKEFSETLREATGNNQKNEIYVYFKDGKVTKKNKFSGLNIKSESLLSKEEKEKLKDKKFALLTSNNSLLVDNNYSFAWISDIQKVHVKNKDGKIYNFDFY